MREQKVNKGIFYADAKGSGLVVYWVGANEQPVALDNDKNTNSDLDTCIKYYTKHPGEPSGQDGVSGGVTLQEIQVLQRTTRRRSFLM